MIIRSGGVLEYLLEMRSSGAVVSLTTGNTRYSLYNIEERLRQYNIDPTCFSTVSSLRHQ